MLRQVSCIVACVLFTACASGSPTTRPMSSSALGREVLTAAEIVAARATDVYQAVTQLRPEFLRRRPGALAVSPFSEVPIYVYLDDMPYGRAESLKQIPLERVRLIRHISSTEANLKYGGSHPAGAILVTTQAR
jgi:hypothetical protein